MKSKIKIIGVSLIFAALISINFLSIDRSCSNDLNLDSLIKVAQAEAEGTGTLECKCVSAPGDESGCWSYNYSDPSCGGSNAGYTGSTQCQGAGYIEQHVRDCN